MPRAPARKLFQKKPLFFSLHFLLEKKSSIEAAVARNGSFPHPLLLSSPPAHHQSQPKIVAAIKSRRALCSQTPFLRCPRSSSDPGEATLLPPSSAHTFAVRGRREEQILVRAAGRLSAGRRRREEQCTTLAPVYPKYHRRTTVDTTAASIAAAAADDEKTPTPHPLVATRSKRVYLPRPP